MLIDLKEQVRKDLYDAKGASAEKRREIKNMYIDKWQDRWNSSEKERHLYMTMPDVGERVKLKINQYSTQFLTGHKNFLRYLVRFGITETENCDAM